MRKLLALVSLAAAAVDCSQKQLDKPNFLFILADDLGFGDIGYHSADILTPRLDALANSGLILEQSYAQPLCVPTRTALLTGMYPFHVGTQVGVWLGGMAVGMPTDFPILPEALRYLGYASHIVGKWHLGFCHESFLPLARGFDTQYGYWDGGQDYYTKDNGNGSAYDFHLNDQLLDQEPERSEYSTYLYRDRAKSLLSEHASSGQPFFLYLAMQSPHTPNQVPQHYLDLHPDLPDNTPRKLHAAMISALDEAVGDVVDHLRDLGLYDNTVIVFAGDNGAQVPAGGSNVELRGMKGMVYEGGTRTPAFVHSPLIQKQGVVSTQLVHMSDWFPTLLRAAGADDALFANYTANIDGVDQFEAIFGTTEDQIRHEMVYNIVGEDQDGDARMAAIRDGPWKVVAPFGPFGNQFQLFNLETDPNEESDVSGENQDITDRLVQRLRELVTEMVPAIQDGGILDGDGVDENGNVVTNWCDLDEVIPQPR